MRRLSTLLAILFALTASSAASAFAFPQDPNPTGVIRGTATDQQGAVVAGADVQAVHNQTNQRFTTKTTNEGAFELIGLPFADYHLTISAAGFTSYQMRITLGKDLSVAPHDAVLQASLGEVRLDVKMVGEASTVTMCIVCSYTYFSIPYVDLPLLKRDPQRLIALQPGVAEHQDGFSIAGRRLENQTASLDGFDNRDPATGRFITTLALEALQEFNSDATNTDTSLSAGYGQTSAPQLAALTRAGTNTYHAQGFWHLGRTGLDANNFFTNRGALPRDQTMHDQAGFTFGGNPVLPGVFNGKDRAFFFIAYERTRDREAIGRQIVAPLASFVERTRDAQGELFRRLLEQGRMPLADGRAGGLQDIDGDGLADIGDAAVRSSMRLAQTLALARVDLNLSDKLQLSLRYDRDQSHRLDDFYESSFTPAAPLDAARKGELLGLQFSAVINSAMINDLRLGYRRGRATLTGAGSDDAQVIALNSPVSTGSGVPELPETRKDRALVFADAFTLVTGAHTLNVGAQVIHRHDSYTSDGLLQGRIYYADALALVTDGRRSARDPSLAIVRAEIAATPAREQYRLTDLYAFTSDHWLVTPRLIFNYGLGYNIYSGAIYERRTDKNNFAPFVSFAYSPTASERVILRGGASIIYVPPTLAPYGEIKATPFYPVATGFATRGELVHSSEWATRRGAVEIEREYSHDMRAAYTESAFLAVQHSFSNRLILEVGYNATLGHRLTNVYHNDRARLEQTFAARDGSAAKTEEILIATDGNSSYHALQVRVTSRERRRITFQAHYTFAKTIDTTSDDRPSMFRALALGPVDARSVALERGASDFDRRHRALGFFQWRGPALDHANRALRWAFSDWQMSGIVTLQSGPRVTLYSSGDYFSGRGDFNHDGVLNDRVAYLGAGAFARVIQRGARAADRYFDASSFGAPDASHHALGRNVLPAPSTRSIDLAAQKRFSFTDDHKLVVRVEGFNVTNRVNFAPPVTDFASAAFGRSVAAFHPRIVRVALKYSF